MIHEIGYANRTEVIEDFMYDANRKIPVELICLAKDVRFYLSHILATSNAELKLLDFNVDDIEGIEDNDEVVLEISHGMIYMCPLIMYSKDKERQKLFSGDGCLRYVSSECDEFFFNDEDTIGVFKFIVEE